MTYYIFSFGALMLTRTVTNKALLRKHSHAIPPVT